MDSVCEVGGRRGKERGEGMGHIIKEKLEENANISYIGGRSHVIEPRRDCIQEIKVLKGMGGGDSFSQLSWLLFG